MHLTQAEAELEWLFAVAPALLDIGCQSYDPDARGDTPGWEYSDRQIEATTKAKHLREAFERLTKRQQEVLTVYYTPTSFVGDDFADYKANYGPRIAAVIRELNPDNKGNKDKESRRLRDLQAQVWVRNAQKAYVELRGEYENAVHSIRAGRHGGHVSAAHE